LPRRATPASAPAKAPAKVPAKVPAVGLVSLGCPKALVDSERIITRLREEGYRIEGSYARADVVVVNTCGFLDSAVQESLDAIGEALHENGRVIVTGCLGEKRDADGVRLVERMHPKVLAVTGPHDEQGVVDAVHRAIAPPHAPRAGLVPEAGIRLTPRHYAYLKIAEGCNQRCTFCIIPSMRGDLVSRPLGGLVREAEALVKGGAREILIVSQDTMAYGSDLRYRTEFLGGRPVKTRLSELVREIGRLGAWIRLHYMYPYPAIDAILPLIAEGLALPYLDVPFQHAHPRILRLMKRPAAAESNLARIRAWREAVPGLAIRSTFIAGFPGETEEEFQVLLDFLREARLERVGCFAYSPVEGAAANALPGALPEAVREERRGRLMELQAGISRDLLRERVGTVQRVLVDQCGPGGAVGRSFADAPEIDGVVHVAAHPQLRSGEFFDVRIERSDEHDLFGALA
jgi:ribosomal protein S12 methylthiotransferase